jgi:hypothetical protein
MIRKQLFQFALRFGVEDRVLAVFMFSGPLIILAFALIGRTAITTVISTAYVGLFVLYVASKGVLTDEK